MSEEKNKGGRPPFYETPEQLQTAIDNYFALDEKKTITGLAYFLGFESRQSFYDYEETPEFSYAIKRARLKIESIYETCLQGTACTGAIFALKNHGWKDAIEQKQTGTLTNLNVTVDSNDTLEELRRVINGGKAD